MKSQRAMALLLMLVLPLGFAGIWRLQHGIDSQLASVSQERDDVLLSHVRGQAAPQGASKVAQLEGHDRAAAAMK